MTVSFYGSVQDGTNGDKSCEAECTESLYTLIELLGERYGESFKEFLLGDETCFFLVNGNGIMATGGLRTPLHHDDNIEVLPFVNGG